MRDKSKMSVRQGLTPLSPDDIYQAIANNQFELWSQPIVRIDNETMAYEEILLRLRKSEDHVEPPSYFLPSAQFFGLNPTLDRIVLSKALEHIEAKPERNLGINLSGALLNEEAPLRSILELLSECPNFASKLLLEITESIPVESPERLDQDVADLHALGVRFIIDDFGTGYSTFDYLRHFPVSYLKMDGTYIQSLNRDRICRAVCSSVIHLARHLGLSTVAETIEDEETLEAVKAIGFSHAQGYFFSEPKPLA